VSVEKAGDALGFVQRQVEGDLRRFKEYIESRGTPTGGWRESKGPGRGRPTRSSEGR
jgi:hypothetical protein